MNAIQLPLISAPHSNNGLFSDYYLNEIVPAQDDWITLSAAARPVRDALRERFATIHPERLDESQLEEQWVKFVLAELGWHYSVQVKIRYTGTGHRKPDYALTGSTESAQALTNQIYAPVELRDAGVLAVADAKKWGIPLDQAPRGERNPSQQIDEYLRYSELRWGILTDGRVWRLYDRDSSKNNVYYAVDLKELLESDEPNALERFFYFYAFFRQIAFAPDSWLDRTRISSRDFAQNLSETLEDQVYDALELIAQGFLDYRRNTLQPTPDTLRELYEQSLVLLYRLLFILYAESRDILPLSDNASYRQTRSLHALKSAIAQAGGRDMDADGSDYYARLKDLFFGIDQGNPRYSLPAYNGGLFAAADHPFLDKYVIGDRDLAHAIDKMARIRDKFGNLLMIDYRDLEVRHLGAIYEKLLDYQLHIATESLTLKDGAYSPAKTGETAVKSAGQVYLRTGNNQRHATGSYYTPTYIVRFIVERTLEPLLTAITERYAARDADGRWIVREPDTLQTAILALNVLDPATGSGHFMVDAMAYIAEWLRGLALAPADLSKGEDELLYWKRQVVLACIYGVDVNPLAVELAKLSLWLATLSRGKPLSFLDHHIQCGNTLIGARASEIGLFERGRKKVKMSDAPQDNAPTLIQDPGFASVMGTAVGQMTAIEHTRAETIQQVKQQEEQYQALRTALAPWIETANVWTAQYFGVPIESMIVWRQLRNQLRGELSGLRLPDAAARIEKAKQIAQTQNFLHWELVFPEVFFEPDGTPKAAPGFDAIIGNPPYVRQEYIQPIKNFLAAKYPDVYSGTADLYVYFYGRGLELLRRGGLLSYVTANKWFRAGYGEGLRGHLAERATVHEIVDFGHAPIFKGADTFPAVMVIGKPEVTTPLAINDDEHAARITIFPRNLLHVADLKEYADSHSHRVPTARFGKASWSLEVSDVETLVRKIRDDRTPLNEFVSGKPYRGMVTGFNDAFLIDTNTRNVLIDQDAHAADIIKPCLRGDMIKRWYPEWADSWMVLLKSSENYVWPWATAGDKAEAIFAETYPTIYRFFKTHEDAIRNRKNHGRFWWELNSCSFYDLYERPKLVYQEIQFHSWYALDTQGNYLNNKGFFLPTVDLYLLSVLNSPLMWWHNWRYLPHMKDEALSPTGERMVSLPIAPPTDAIRAEVEPAARRLIELTKTRRDRMHDVLDWLRVEFAVTTPGQKLEAFARLDESAFMDEVKKRRPKAPQLTPASLRTLTSTFHDYAAQIATLDAESDGLERRVSDLVNVAYGLSAAEIDLMWRTAPPRMPFAR